MALLTGGHVVQHPFVTDELAMGPLHDWNQIIDDLNALPRLAVADDHELYRFVVQYRLAGSGVGLVDAHLMATEHRAGVRIWTRDARLATHADKLGIAFMQ